jgi:UDP-N-acetylmuramoyl-L-alanyl-D-glutamate--2,6-diaminopimelate ligase
MRLAELCRAVRGARVPDAAAELEVHAVESDSRAISPGDLFVAVAGARNDGRNYAAGAVERGAIAVVSETPLQVPVPVVLVPDARLALAQLGAEASGRPAERLQLIGITGTVGKTSVLTMLSAIFREAGIAAGSVGSLGIEYPGGREATPTTTPGALQLQRALAEMAEAGADVVAMEVTSHALSQGRVHGLAYDVGVFTNLTMLEHLEYHGSFRAYAEAKQRFLSHLQPDGPIVFTGSDRAVRQLVAAHTGPLISCGGHSACMVTVRRESLSPRGARVRLTIRRPLPRPGREPLRPLELPLELATLGRPGTQNATLAAVAALCSGAAPEAVRSALAGLQPPPRRLQIVRTADPCIIDDTVGHPDSITGVFEVARQIRHRRLVIVFCIRGQRGPVINRRDAEALAIWSRSVPVDTLLTTAATDTADERNEVTAEERAAFLRVLDDAGLKYTHHDRLNDAIDDAAAEAGVGDLLLLLGAQGMDAGAGLALDRVGEAE